MNGADGAGDWPDTELQLPHQMAPPARPRCSAADTQPTYTAQRNFAVAFTIFGVLVLSLFRIY